MPVLENTEPYSDVALFKRNVDLLARHAPQLRSLFDSTRQSYTLGRVEDGFQMFDQKGNALFPAPEPDYSRARRQAFLDDPYTLSHQKYFRHVPDKYLWGDPVKTILKDLPPSMWRKPIPCRTAHSVAFVDVPESTVFVDLLKEFENLSAVYIFIYDIFYFLMTLHYSDWQQVYEYIDENSISLEFHYIQNSAAGADFLSETLVPRRFLMADEVPVYFHFNDPQLREMQRLLPTKYTNRRTGVGFFSDELEMIKSTRANILVHKRPVVSKRPAHEGTAIIVGSGPSLDRSMDALKACADKGYVIAAGTAVEPLLDAGIKVDCCVILERGTVVPAVFRDMANRVDLKQVPMVASSTVDPETEAYFKEASYFFRPGLNVCDGFDRDRTHTLNHCDPTVSNTAFGLGLHLGFRKFVLFGVDFGTADPTRHHTRNSAYYRSDEVEEKLEVNPIKMDETAIGAFGNLVESNLVLNWARLCLEKGLAARTDVLAVSVGDGAQIKGAVPLLPDAAHWLPTMFPLLKAPYPDDVLKGEPYTADQYNYDPRQLEEYMTILSGLIKQLTWEDREAVTRKLYRALYMVRRVDPFKSILRGEVSEIVWSFLSLLNRMTEEERRQYEEPLRAAMVEALDMMKRDLLAVIEEGAEPADAAPPDACP